MERLLEFNEITVPGNHTTEHIPVLGCVLSEGTARDRCDPFIGPSPNGLPSISEDDP